MKLSRRGFLAGVGGYCAIGCNPGRAHPRVVIVGGGFAGASCARTLGELDARIEVVLLERRNRFMTGPFTNAVIAGLRTPDSIRFSPRTLSNDRVRVVLDSATEIDPEKRSVRTAGGQTLRADALVLAPGVELQANLIEGLSEHGPTMPAAWTGDKDILSLRKKLAALPDGATVVVGAPANPYRCPPGPYERASLIAAAISKRRGKVLVCDAKDDFTKRALFQLEWDIRYPDTVEWIPRAQGGRVVRAEAAGRITLENGDRIESHLASIVPPQRAGAIARAADLADESGWCPVNPWSFESTRHRSVYVLGDSASVSPMPKSAFCANGQGKLAALSILRAFRGLDLAPEKIINTCFSLTTADHAISVSAVYEVTPGQSVIRIASSGKSALGGNDALRQEEARYARQWYRAITQDTFGQAS